MIALKAVRIVPNTYVYVPHEEEGKETMPDLLANPMPEESMR